MRSKTITLDLDVEASAAIARAVAGYARAAYPAGGSECSQVAHETLLDTAKLLEQAQGQSVDIRRRQLALVKAAVNWYFSAAGPEPSDMQQAYLDQLASGKAG